MQVILKPVVGKQRHQRLAHLQFDRLGDRVGLALLVLRHDARRLDHLAKLARAAVGDGRFVRVQFDDGVVDAVAGEGGQDVLHRLDLGVALGQRGGAVRSRKHSRRAPRSPACLPGPRGGSGCRCSAGAGRKVMLTRLPLCRPMPEKLADRLRVCCCSTTALEQNANALGKREIGACAHFGRAFTSIRVICEASFTRFQPAPRSRERGDWILIASLRIPTVSPARGGIFRAAKTPPASPRAERGLPTSGATGALRPGTASQCVSRHHTGVASAGSLSTEPLATPQSTHGLTFFCHAKN